MILITYILSFLGMIKMIIHKLLIKIYCTIKT